MPDAYHFNNNAVRLSVFTFISDSQQEVSYFHHPTTSKPESYRGDGSDTSATEPNQTRVRWRNSTDDALRYENQQMCFCQRGSEAAFKVRNPIHMMQPCVKSLIDTSLVLTVRTEGRFQIRGVVV